MKTSSASLLSSVFALLLSISCAASADKQGFLQCLSLHSQNSMSVSDVIYTPNNPSYQSVLDFSIQNLRFASPETPKPVVIVTPLNESQIQSVVYCSKKHGLQIRVRSGGHDMEGISYVSDVPFVIVDLINLRSISVHVENATAWVQGGATLGEVYYTIAQNSRTLAFPAGVCPPVGVGGHITGGGSGTLIRKYGVAADSVIDARLIDASGKILDRKSMGEDLFWAIRGGAGASFGVIVAWKIKLVAVPENVTIFAVQRTLEQNATELVHRWQYVAHKLHEDLFLRVRITTVNSSNGGKRTIQALFDALFLGGVDRLLSLMHRRFPELGLVNEDCISMSWIESTLYFGGFQSEDSLDVLLNRTSKYRVYSKIKSDYVKEPIPETGLKGIWKFFDEDEAKTAEISMDPYGGIMSEISESAIPFPHRAGNLYLIAYVVYWFEEGTVPSQKHINWVRRLYNYTTPYVSMSPREAYFNYKDLDLGVNNIGITSSAQASVWGVKYFKNNFHKLVSVKTRVDPDNFFRNEQSIPPLSSWSAKNIISESLVFSDTCINEGLGLDYRETRGADL